MSWLLSVAGDLGVALVAGVDAAVAQPVPHGVVLDLVDAAAGVVTIEAVGAADGALVVGGMAHVVAPVMGGRAPDRAPLGIPLHGEGWPGLPPLAGLRACSGWEGLGGRGRAAHLTGVYGMAGEVLEENPKKNGQDATARVGCSHGTTRTTSEAGPSPTIHTAGNDPDAR